MASNITEIPLDIISSLGGIALWLQGVGVLLIAWIIFQAVSLYIDRKRMKEIYSIKKDMKRIENKIDKLIKKS